MIAPARRAAPPRAWAAGSRLLALTAALAGLLAGCYFPSDFQADLRIASDGRYNFRYVGYLTSLPLLQKIARGEVPADSEGEAVRIVRRDLARDSGFEEIAYSGNARFRVRYERQGDIRRDRSFNFVRFNARFLGIKVVEDGTVTVFGDRPNAESLRQLEEVGLVGKGRLRIQTDAAVTRHNAKEVQPGKEKIYVWRIASLQDPTPKLVFTLR